MKIKKLTHEIVNVIQEQIYVILKDKVDNQENSSFIVDENGSFELNNLGIPTWYTKLQDILEINLVGYSKVDIEELRFLDLKITLHENFEQIKDKQFLTELEHLQKFVNSILIELIDPKTNRTCITLELEIDGNTYNRKDLNKVEFKITDMNILNLSTCRDELEG